MPQKVTIPLNSEQTLKDIKDLDQRLKSALNKQVDTAFTADEVQRIDTATLQLLCSFCQQAKQNNIKVSWLSASDYFKHQAQLLGMQAFLGIE